MPVKPDSSDAHVDASALKSHDYDRVLTAFRAETRRSADCIRHLVSLGFTMAQARSAVYRYRLRHGRISKRNTR